MVLRSALSLAETMALMMGDLTSWGFHLAEMSASLKLKDAPMVSNLVYLTKKDSLKEDYLVGMTVGLKEWMKGRQTDANLVYWTKMGSLKEDYLVGMTVGTKAKASLMDVQKAGY